MILDFAISFKRAGQPVLFLMRHRLQTVQNYCTDYDEDCKSQGYETGHDFSFRRESMAFSAVVRGLSPWSNDSR